MNSKRIESVKARLDFVSKFSELSQDFKGIKHIYKLDNGGWEHPYKHYDALRFYLLLTCFDILGGEKDYIDFSAWLKSSKHKEERDEIFSQLNISELSPTSVGQIFKCYNQIYGVSKGFKRCFTDVISSQDCQELLNSIKIRKISTYPQKELETIEDNNKKIKFLYLMRNEFTHYGQSISSSEGGIIFDIEDPIIINGKEKWGYRPIHRETKDVFFYEYSVRKWPQLLIDIITRTVSRYI